MKLLLAILIQFCIFGSCRVVWRAVLIFRLCREIRRDLDEIKRLDAMSRSMLREMSARERVKRAE